MEESFYSKELKQLAINTLVQLNSQEYSDAEGNNNAFETKQQLIMNRIELPIRKISSSNSPRKHFNNNCKLGGLGNSIVNSNFEYNTNYKVPSFGESKNLGVLKPCEVLLRKGKKDLLSTQLHLTNNECLEKHSANINNTSSRKKKKRYTLNLGDKHQYHELNPNSNAFTSSAYASSIKNTLKEIQLLPFLCSPSKLNSRLNPSKLRNFKNSFYSPMHSRNKKEPLIELKPNCPQSPQSTLDPKIIKKLTLDCGSEKKSDWKNKFNFNSNNSNCVNEVAVINEEHFCRNRKEERWSTVNYAFIPKFTHLLSGDCSVVNKDGDAKKDFVVVSTNTNTNGNTNNANAKSNNSNNAHRLASNNVIDDDEEKPWIAPQSKEPSPIKGNEKEKSVLSPPRFSPRSKKYRLKSNLVLSPSQIPSTSEEALKNQVFLQPNQIKSNSPNNSKPSAFATKGEFIVDKSNIGIGKIKDSVVEEEAEAEESNSLNPKSALIDSQKKRKSYNEKMNKESQDSNNNKTPNSPPNQVSKEVKITNKTNKSCYCIVF